MSGTTFSRKRQALVTFERRWLDKPTLDALNRARREKRAAQAEDERRRRALAEEATKNMKLNEDAPL